MKFDYNINPVNKSYYFLTATERALIERSLMDWHLQEYLQKTAIPETTIDMVIDSILLIESMNDVELIEGLALVEASIFGGCWQSANPKEGSMILAVRPEIYELFKAGRTKDTKAFFEEQGWNYEGQFIKKMVL